MDTVALAEYILLRNMHPSRFPLVLYHQHYCLGILLKFIQKPLIVARKTRGKQSGEPIVNQTLSQPTPARTELDVGREKHPGIQ